MKYELAEPAWLPVFSFLDNIPLPSCSAEWGEGVVMAESDIDFTYTKPFSILQNDRNSDRDNYLSYLGNC